MDKTTLDAIKQKQEDYFNAVKEVNAEGNNIKNNLYNQIKRGEQAGYWVDVYDGPQGKGYTVKEKKEELGKTYIKSRHFGVEEYRNKNNDQWVEVKE